MMNSQRFRPIGHSPKRPAMTGITLSDAESSTVAPSIGVGQAVLQARFSVVARPGAAVAQLGGAPGL
jgi:hypothetical protein